MVLKVLFHIYNMTNVVVKSWSSSKRTRKKQTEESSAQRNDCISK